MKKYIAETKEQIYYRRSDDSLVMLRNGYSKFWDNQEVVESALYEDIKEGKITKISPDFIYDYREIFKQIWNKEF